MKCLHPNKGTRIINGNTHTYEYPCGKCNHCLRTKQSQIKLRLLLESTLSPNNAFVTFTYNDLFVPEELKKDDAQKLLKRLRKEFTRIYGKGATFKHYLVGEYGTRTGRPHFHAILFGYPYQDITTLETAWRRNVGTARKPKYASLGFVHSREVTAARAGYLVKYTTKFLESAASGSGDKCPEFAIMSKRSGGIGLGYLRAFIASIRRSKEVHPIGRKTTLADFFDTYVGSITIGSSRMSIDPYFRSKIYKYLREIDEPSIKGSIKEQIRRDRKAEFRKSINARRRMAITLEAHYLQEDEKRKADIAAQRRQRATKNKIKT